MKYPWFKFWPTNKSFDSRECPFIYLNLDKLFVLHLPLILSLLIHSVFNTSNRSGWAGLQGEQTVMLLTNVLKNKKNAKCFQEWGDNTNSCGCRGLRAASQAGDPSGADLWVSEWSVSPTLWALQLSLNSPVCTLDICKTGGVTLISLLTMTIRHMVQNLPAAPTPHSCIHLKSQLWSACW